MAVRAQISQDSSDIVFSLILIFEISKVSQCLDPEVSRFGRFIIWGVLLVLLADSEYIIVQLITRLLLHVKIKQLLPQIELLTHDLHAVEEVVDLEKEHYVFFVDFNLITFDEEHDLVAHLDFVFTHLSFVEHALEQSVPNIHLRNKLDFELA